MNRAAIVEVPGQPMRVEAVEVLPPRRGDLHYISGHFTGPLPFIPGHEGAGVVESIGPGVDTVQAGDHVIFIPAHCGECFYCQHDRPMLCEAGGRLSGAGVCVMARHGFFGRVGRSTTSLASPVFRSARWCRSARS